MAQVEIFHERARRRWTEEDKRRLVAETLGPGGTVHGVARRHGVDTSQLFIWRKQLRLELEPAAAPVPGFAAVAITPTGHVRERGGTPGADRDRAAGRGSATDFRSGRSGPG